MARFVAAPRQAVAAAIGNSVRWRVLGERWLAEAKATCPVSHPQDGQPESEHLKDTLVLRVIGGADPRLLVGSVTKGNVLRYVTDGTPAHLIKPQAATVLRFTGRGGTVVFAATVDHPGTKKNSFALDAIKRIVRTSI